MSYNKGYVVTLARCIDILACGWIWRNYDVTVSSMCGLELRRPAPRWWARWLGGFLNWLQTGHCESAIEADTARAVDALVLLGSR